jgi:hypothetical protein
MNLIKIITAAAVAVTLTLGAATSSFADDYDDDDGGAYHGPNNNFAEGQNPSGPQHPPGCVRDFWGTTDCGPDSWGSFGPYDRQHAMERGDHILR